MGPTPWKAECIAATIVCRNRDVRQTSFCKTHRPGIDAEFPQAIAVHGHATPVARPITLPGTRVFSGTPKFHEGNDRSVEADQLLMRLLTRLHRHRPFPSAWTRSHIRGITTSFMWSIVTQVSIYCGVSIAHSKRVYRVLSFSLQERIFQPLRCDP